MNMSKYQEYLSETKITKADQNIEINEFSSDNNIFLVKKTKKTATLYVNGTLIKVTKHPKTYKSYSMSQGQKWGELQSSIKGVKFTTDLFDDVIFGRRGLELALLRYSKTKNLADSISPKDYTLDNGTYGEYRPFIFNWI